jgi:hypothetical protein
MRRSSLTALAALLLLSACGAPSATEGVARGRARSSGPFGMISPDAIKTTGSSAFKGLEQVTIGSFIVGFGTYDTLSGKDGKYGSAARNTLVGIDDATLGKITDDAYQRFAQALRQAGYTVADPAPLLTNPRFAGSKSYPNPYVDSSGGLFGDKSTVRYIAPSSAPAMKIFAGDIAGTMGGFGPDNPHFAASEYVKAGGPPVLHVVYLLNFVNDARATGLRLNNAAKVGQGLTVAADASKISVVSGSDGAVSLGQPITSDREFATVTDATSSGNLAGQAAANVLTGLMGAGGSQSRNFDFVARPADYAAASIDAMDQANASLIAKMTSLK